MNKRLVGVVVGVMLATVYARAMGAAETGKEQSPPQQAAGKAMLPQEHEYQRQLRAYMATLAEKDFDAGHPAFTAAPVGDNPDEQYRMWLLTLEVPSIGLKRKAPVVTLPAAQFTLAYIEGGEKVICPAIWCEPATWLANWKYAGNPYYGSRAMKLRAFVTASVDLMMMDNMQEHTDAHYVHRADWFGPRLIMYGYTLAGVKDAVPAEARAAFGTGLKKLIRTMCKEGPIGDEVWLDVSFTTGLALAAKALDDPEITELAKSYSQRLYANEEYYNPAGYFVDWGCYDPGFNGLCLFFATWTAGASDWDFAQQAAKQALKLRSYLCLPEPDGKLVGPSHMTLRTGSDPAHDQWDWAFRFGAGALLTDDALCTIHQPTPEQLAKAPANVAGTLNAMINENAGQLPTEKLASSPWRWSLWPTGKGQFPMANYAFDNYQNGTWARIQALVKADSPLLKYPFQREGTFVETFGKAFVVARMPGFGVVIHTGPVGHYPGKDERDLPEMPGPYGLGGGTLSAFWTPSTGSVLLGRRAGMAIRGPDILSFDKLEEWRTWPVHAVSGATAAGKFFTSARIERPEAVYEIKNDRATVKVSGVLPAVPVGHDKALSGRIEYSRQFDVAPDGLRVQTTLKGDGADEVSELYEVLPVFLHDGLQKPDLTATVEFQVGGNWAAGTPEPQRNVTAVRITRFTGAVQITFDRPRRVQLSPQDWKDTYMSGATCRNVLVDLLDAGDKPGVLKGERTVSYTISPVNK